MVVDTPDITVGRASDTLARTSGSRLLRLAAAGTLLFSALTVIAFHAPVAQSVDRAALQGFQIGRNSAEPANVHHVAHSAKPLPLALMLGAAVAVALVRRQPRRAVAAVAIVTGAGVLTQVLKTALATPRAAAAAATYSVNAASYPSGHATATLSLVLAALVVVPGRLIPLTAIAGGVWSLAVSFAMLILHRHFPSDLLAGYLVAGVCGLVVVAWLRPGEPGGAPVRLPPRMTAASGIALLVLAPLAFAAGDGSHTPGQRGAAAVVAAALVVGVAVALAWWAATISAMGPDQ